MDIDDIDFSEEGMKRKEKSDQKFEAALYNALVKNKMLPGMNDMHPEEIRVRSLLASRNNQRDLISDIQNEFAYMGLYPEIQVAYDIKPDAKGVFIQDQITHKKPDMQKLPGGWEFNEDFKFEETSPYINLHKVDESLIYSIDNLISENDCNRLIELMKGHNLAPVTIQGRQDYIDDRIGSNRATCWSETLSNALYDKLRKFLFARIMKETTSTDWWQNDKDKIAWTPRGLSPLLRFMKYEKGGQHYAHYDAGYIRPGEYRTLMSLVLYLTTNENGGGTRFVKDGQEHLPVWEREHNDWLRETKEDEVYLTVSPKAGRILLFDHRICHDVEQYLGDNDRIIIRGDVIFKTN